MGIPSAFVAGPRDEAMPHTGHRDERILKPKVSGSLIDFPDFKNKNGLEFNLTTNFKLYEGGMYQLPQSCLEMWSQQIWFGSPELVLKDLYPIVQLRMYY